MKDILEMNHTMMANSWIQNRRESLDPKRIPERQQTIVTDRSIELREDEERAHGLKQKEEEEREKERQRERKKNNVSSRNLCIVVQTRILCIIVQTLKAECCGVFYLYYLVCRKYMAESRHCEYKRLVQSHKDAFTSTASRKRRPVAKISDFFPEPKRGKA